MLLKGNDVSAHPYHKGNHFIFTQILIKKCGPKETAARAAYFHLVVIKTCSFLIVSHSVFYLLDNVHFLYPYIYTNKYINIMHLCSIFKQESLGKIKGTCLLMKETTTRVLSCFLNVFINSVCI